MLASRCSQQMSLSDGQRASVHSEMWVAAVSIARERLINHNGIKIPTQKTGYAKDGMPVFPTSRLSLFLSLPFLHLLSGCREAPTTCRDVEVVNRQYITRCLCWLHSRVVVELAFMVIGYDASVQNIIYQKRYVRHIDVTIIDNISRIKIESFTVSLSTMIL